MPRNANRPPLIFSVDVEDWGQSVLDRSLPISEHSAENVRRLLDLLVPHPAARGTFFILGKFAQRHPGVVHAIDAAGHEIACHGHGHVELHKLGPDAFRDDLRRAVATLADITGRKPIGHRAPVFSITNETLWALGVLQQEGFEYDSSIYPYKGARYGIPDWPTHPTRVHLDADPTGANYVLSEPRPSGSGHFFRRPLSGGGLLSDFQPLLSGSFHVPRSIIEYPLTVKDFAGRRFPISGGGAARIIPKRLLIRWLHHESSRRSAGSPSVRSSPQHRDPSPFPPVFYCHPHELDPHEFRRPPEQRTWGDRRVPLTLRLHQGLGRDTFAAKLRALLDHFTCHSFEQVLAPHFFAPSNPPVLSTRPSAALRSLQPA